MEKGIFFYSKISQTRAKGVEWKRIIEKECGYMLRMHQKIKWTRTELQKFAEYDGLECEAMLMAEDAMWCGGGVAVGSSIHQRLEEIGKELCTLRDSLKALMGTTRFNILMNDRFTMKAWRGEVSARYIAKHPWAAPEDCRPGWE